MKRTAALTALAVAFVLSMAACGGGGGSATPTSPAPGPTSASTGVPPSHSAQPGGPALIAVPGYDYVNPPSGVTGSAHDIVSADPQHLKSASVYGVRRGGTVIAVILLVQVQPQYADLPGVQQGIVSALARQMTGPSANVTTETIHSEKVVVVNSASEAGYAWYHNGVITLVVGSSNAKVRDYVGAYLQAAHTTAA